VRRVGRIFRLPGGGIARASGLLRPLALAVLLLFAHGCATEPKLAQLMQVGPQAAANRALQTRRFSEVSEAELLAACVSVLQDLGFRITASEARLGVVTGDKPRSDADMLADVGRLSLLAGITMGLHPELSKGFADSFGVVLATRGVGDGARVHETRATFYLGYVGGYGGRHAVLITSPVLYQRFFGMVDMTLARTRSGN
jgi:hypothetical protein